MPKQGHVGTSLGGMEFSPDRKKQDAARRKRQEKRWASKSGEVRVSRIEPPVQPDESSSDETADHD